MDSTNHSGNNSPIVSLTAAAGVTAASFIPVLTDWVRLATAVIGLICALYGAYKLFFKR
jgi:hypothetical protein